MTGKRATICITEDKSPVEVRRKMAEMMDFRRISIYWGLSEKRIGHFGDPTP
jgi:hypothetical protein